MIAVYPNSITGRGDRYWRLRGQPSYLFVENWYYPHIVFVSDHSFIRLLFKIVLASRNSAKMAKCLKGKFNK